MSRKFVSRAGLLVLCVGVAMWMPGCPLPGTRPFWGNAGPIRGAADLPASIASGTILTPAGQATTGTAGAFSLSRSLNGSFLAILTNPSGNPSLLGWLDAQYGNQQAISAQTTAEVLLFYALGGFALPPSEWETVRTLISQAPETGALATVIAARLTVDPNALTSGDTQIGAALVTATQQIMAKGGHDALSGVLKGLVIQPDTLSGVTVEALPRASAINSFTIANAYRRRAWVFVHHVKDYIESDVGDTVEVARDRSVLSFRLNGASAPDGALTALDGLASGAVAYTPVALGPYSLGTLPSTISQREYQVLVVGPGNPATPNPAAESRLTDAMREKQQAVAFEWFFRDFAMPAFLAVIPWNTADAPSMVAFESLLGDLQTIALARAGGLAAQIAAGQYEAAFLTLINAMANDATLRQQVAARIMADLGQGPAVSSAQLNGTQAALARVLAAFDIPNIIATGPDTGIVFRDVMAAAPAEYWQILQVPLEVAIDPDETTVLGGEEAGFSVTVTDGAENITQNLRYVWSLTSSYEYGTLRTSGGVEGLTVTTADNTVTFAATGTIGSEHTVTLTCEVSQFAAGSGTWTTLGSGTATITVQPSIDAGRLFGFVYTYYDGAILKHEWAVGVEFDKVTDATRYRINGSGYNDPAFWGTALTVEGVGTTWTNGAFGLAAEFDPQLNPDCEYAGLAGGSGNGDGQGALTAGLARFDGAVFEVSAIEYAK